MTHKRSNPRKTPDARAGFTLVELLVAITIVLALSVSIGGIFNQVGKLVSTGSAVSEVDQIARAMERQMRDDFAGLSSLPAQDSFFVIRSRTLGDINHNGQVDSPADDGEKAVYLNQDDKDYDTLNNLAPYQVDAARNLKSRAVTVRLDEMCFIAPSSDKAPFTSYQQPGRENRAVTGEAALITYGHGMRPPLALKPNGDAFDPTQPVDQNNRPVRALYPDGIDPTAVYQQWGDVFGKPFSRNEFAGQFPLLRAPLILYGGRALGNAGQVGPSPIGERNVAPFIRDREGEVRFAIIDSALSSPPYLPWAGLANQSRLRVARWGRTDICAQSLEDAKRWLEGEPPRAATEPAIDATAFSEGAYDITPNPADVNYNDYKADNARPDHALYYRSGSNIKPVGLSLQTQYAQLLRGEKSALAGCMTRRLCEPGQTYNPRFVLPVDTSGQTPDPDSRDAVMDQHAVFADRCSNFEIAWSDGSTWPSTNPLTVTIGSGPGQTTLTYNRGDVVWFDRDFTRRQYRRIVGATENALNGQPDPEIISQEMAPFPVTSPGTPGSVGIDRNATTIDNSTTINIDRTRDTTGQAKYVGAYDWGWSGGTPSEYLAIFGFRAPGANWDYKDEAWVKPKLIRVRMTLHDGEGRLKNGKDYEFVFRIDQPTE